MNAGGMSRRIVDCRLACVGHMRGGLGYVAVFAAMLMAAMSGSAAADAAVARHDPAADDAQRRLRRVRARPG
jgi:TRAP-type C4-dicarboxylate transport system permease large subunit